MAAWATPFSRAPNSVQTAQIQGRQHQRYPGCPGNHDTAAVETQTSIKTLWGISQSAVSQTLQQLTTAAAVEALPRKGRDPILYTLTGTARLAF
jgi:hypothetical protein